jgi:hypothetical protein
LESVIQVLLAAVLALSFVSLTYAAAGGERVSSGRAASQEMISGIGFAAGGLLLLYSIALTIEASAPGPLVDDGHLIAASRFVRRVLVHGVAPLLVMAVDLGVQDYLSVRDGPDRSASSLDFVAVGFACLAFAASFALYPAGERRQIPRAPRYVAYGGLGVTVCSVLGFAAFGALLQTCEVVPLGVAYAMLSLNLCAMLAAMPLIASRRA